MKKLIAMLTLFALFTLSACTSKPQPEIPNLAPYVVDNEQTKDTVSEAQLEEQGSETVEQNNTEVFSEIFSLYQQAVEEKWDGNKLLENSMSLVMLDCYGALPSDNIGYTYTDLDGNGREDLVIALTDAFTDDFYGKLVLDVYSVNENGGVVQVLSSGNRDRYYYAGSSLFANIGSNSASDSVNTTLKLEGLELIDTNTVTEPADYQQLKLDPLA